MNVSGAKEKLTADVPHIQTYASRSPRSPVSIYGTIDSCGPRWRSCGTSWLWNRVVYRCVSPLPPPPLCPDGWDARLGEGIGLYVAVTWSRRRTIGGVVIPSFDFSVVVVDGFDVSMAGDVLYVVVDVSYDVVDVSYVVVDVSCVVVDVSHVVVDVSCVVVDVSYVVVDVSYVVVDVSYVVVDVSYIAVDVSYIVVDVSYVVVDVSYDVVDVSGLAVDVSSVAVDGSGVASRSTSRASRSDRVGKRRRPYPVRPDVVFCPTVLDGGGVVAQSLVDRVSRDRAVLSRRVSSTVCLETGPCCRSESLRPCV